MKKGSLKIILGPMFSGKTTMLNKELTVRADIGFRTLKVNFSKNEERVDVSKNDGKTSTHNSSYFGMSEKIKVVSFQFLKQLFENFSIENYEVIGIDEVQFFDDLPEAVNKLLEMKKHIICSSLNGDFQQNLFGRVHELIPKADEIEMMKAVCIICKGRELHSAPFTKRLNEKQEQIIIGGKNLYIPVCREHL